MRAPAHRDGIRLTVVYHRAFWRADGSLWEREGAFSRFVEALAERSGSVELVVPLALEAEDSGHPLQARNVTLHALPHWRDLIHFYRLLPGMLLKLWSTSSTWQVLIVRLPTPLGFWAWLVARLRRVPTMLILVGDLAEVADTVPGTSLKRRLFRLWARIEDALMRMMVSSTLTFANGEALWSKYGRGRSNVRLTTNSTIMASDIADDAPRALSRPARLLCVSRIDPRKGVRYLPEVLATLTRRGQPVALTIVGGDVGALGHQERLAAQERARGLGVEDAIEYRGAQPIERVHELERECDVLLVPSLPGEGVPRVIIEAFAAGLPVVASSVAGIPAVVHHEQRGLLVPPADPIAMADATERLLTDENLRERIIENGLEFARAHTIEAQTDTIVAEIERLVAPGSDKHHLPLGEDWGEASTAEESAQPSSQRSLRGGGGRHHRKLVINIPLAGLNLSGGVKSLLYLANALARRGHRVRCIVPDYASTSPVELEEGVELRVLHTDGGPAVLRKLAYFSRLSRDAARDCDVCLANYFLTAYPALASNFLHRNRAVLAYNIRGYEPISHGSLAESGEPGRWIRGNLAALSYRLPLQKICTTDWLKEMVADPRAIVIGHGIDLRMFHPNRHTCSRESATVTLGVIGRSGEVKGYGDFLDSLQRVPRDLGIRVLVAGDDDVPMPAGLPFQHMNTSSEREMAEFYRLCDVFVFPSRAEGFGLPPLEAMACGAAVVLTDCGGVRTYARPGQNCLMAPVQDPEAMASAIKRVVRDATLRASLAQAGLETARQFSRDLAEERFCDLLESLARE